MSLPQQVPAMADLIRSGLLAIFAKGQVVELRVPKAGRDGTIAGFFNNSRALAAAAAELSGKYPGVYVTLNPVNPELFDRAPNCVVTNAERGILAHDKDIIGRRWLPIDFDPVRPADCASTAEEHAAALERAKQARDYLTAKGWPQPIFANSGNGAHLLYRIDLPNDEEAKAAVRGVLAHLKEQFSDDAVKSDTTVSNAARIWKVYGTMSAKGPNTPERPHRLAEIIDKPQELGVVTLEQLQELAPPEPERNTAPAQQAPKNTGHSKYAITALDSACRTIQSAVPGTRNQTLNDECFGIAQLVAAGHLPHGLAFGLLESAAQQCGLDKEEIKATMASAFKAGMENPRDPPARPERRATPDYVRQAPPPEAPPNIDPETGEVTDYEAQVAAANDNTRAAVPAQDGYDIHAVDWYSPFPDVNNKGKPLATIENLKEACNRLGVTVRYNVISKEVEILIPGQGFSLDNEANASLGWIMSACVRFGIPTDKLDVFLCFLADQNPYNPVANWITSKPWDGKERLADLIDTITAEGEAEDASITLLKTAMLLRWMISAVAGAFRPDGVSAHGVLVLQGGQYLGKTAWFKALVPRELGVIQDGMSLRPDDKDSVKQAVSNWLVELGELDATFRKADIAALKAFLTRDRDVLRTAYARKESKFARRTVFFASVNPRQFLHDPTGNRRYWTISCVAINHQHGLDMQQVWAEVYENYYLKGEGWYLTPSEMDQLNGHNKDYEVLDPIKERLQSRYDWEAHQIEWRWLTATDIMQEIGFDKPSRADVTQCGQLVQELNGGKSRKSNGKKLAFVPPKLLTH